MITYEDFRKIDLRIGKIVQAEHFPNAIKPAYKLKINFGDLGVLNSSAQITVRYSPEKLIGRQVIAVVNFETKQIANFLSECLVLGVVDNQYGITLLQPAEFVQEGIVVS